MLRDRATETEFFLENLVSLRALRFLFIMSPAGRAPMNYSDFHNYLNTVGGVFNPDYTDTSDFAGGLRRFPSHKAALLQCPLEKRLLIFRIYYNYISRFTFHSRSLTGEHINNYKLALSGHKDVTNFVEILRRCRTNCDTESMPILRSTVMKIRKIALSIWSSEIALSI